MPEYHRDDEGDYEHVAGTRPKHCARCAAMARPTSEGITHVRQDISGHRAGTFPNSCLKCATMLREDAAEAAAAFLNDPDDSRRCKYEPCPDEPSRLSKIVDYAAASTSVFTTFAVIYLLWENVTNGG